MYIYVCVIYIHHFDTLDQRESVIYIHHFDTLDQRESVIYIHHFDTLDQRKSAIYTPLWHLRSRGKCAGYLNNAHKILHTWVCDIKDI